MKAFDVSHLASKRACLKAEEMCNRIKGVIHEYDEEMPLALALGVLEIVKKEIVEDCND